MVQLLQSRGEERVSVSSCFSLPQVKQGSFYHSFRPQKSWLIPLQALYVEATKKLGSGCPALFSQLKYPEQTKTSLAPILVYHQHLHGQTMKFWPPKLEQLGMDSWQHCSWLPEG